MTIRIRNLTSKQVHRKDGHTRSLFYGVEGARYDDYGYTDRYNGLVDKKFVGKVISGMAGLVIGSITYFKIIQPLISR